MPDPKRPMTIDPQAVLDALAAHEDRAVARLKELLSIPSISTDPENQPDVQRAADWVQKSLEEAGLEVVQHATPGHPVVLGRSKADAAPQGAPRVLFYGHYDVQPPDPVEKWTSPPFKPTVRNGNLFARGASDDKGQVCCFLEALRAWRAASPDGKLPVHVTVLIEGEEEIGSANLPTFLESHKDELDCDVVVISDTSMWDPQTVAITYGLRGLVYFDIKLHGPQRDLHSGMYGNVVANPLNELAKVLGQLFDGDHRVTVPGFYDNVVDVTTEERERWAKLDFDEQAHCLAPTGMAASYGEAGYTTLERKWARPSCDINGLYGGYGGAGAKTVIPSFAGAKVSFRLAPDQDPRHIGRLFEDWLRSFDTHGCAWELTNHGYADPVLVSTDSPYVRAAERAIETASGRGAVLMREGATIPVVADFKKTLGVDSLLIGFGLPEDRIHSPDEHIGLDRFHLGCRSHALLLAEMGAAK